MKKIILILIFIFILNNSTVYAWIIPGTISKGSVITWTWTCDSIIESYNSTCSESWDVVTDSYTNYSNATTKTYFSHNSEDSTYRVISDDNDNFCSVTYNWTNWSTTYWGMCWDTLLYTAIDWGCSYSSSKNYSFELAENWEKVDPNHTDGTSDTCTVEWRIWEKDDFWPKVNTNWPEYSVDTDDWTWCNINRYRKFWKDYIWFSGETPMTHEWCDSYSKSWLNSEWTKTVDLLKDLYVEVETDVSGLHSVKIELWKCSETFDVLTYEDTYTKIREDLNNYKKTIKFEYNNTGSIINWKDVPSLLELFNKDRLDECLTDWKNYLKVTTKDLSRLNSDWITHDWNERTYPKSDELPTYISPWAHWTINIDNAIPSFKAKWYNWTEIDPFANPSELYLSGTNSEIYWSSYDTEPDWFWKNEITSPDIKTSDIYNTVTWSLIEWCLDTVAYQEKECEWNGIKSRLPEWNWFSPRLVDPKSWIFDAKVCSWWWDFPKIKSCNWECPDNKTEWEMCLDTEKPTCCNDGQNSVMTCTDHNDKIKCNGWYYVEDVDEDNYIEPNCSSHTTICCSDKRVGSNDCTFRDTAIPSPEATTLLIDSPIIDIWWDSKCDSLWAQINTCSAYIDGVIIDRKEDIDCSGITKDTLTCN